MYGLVPYNLSPIQQGIQFGHAVVEYSLIYGRSEEYMRWSEVDKTFIILNGGTTNLHPKRPGTLNIHTRTLEEAGVRVASFQEPDLGDQVTATAFLVDERVWDSTLWPDYEGEKNPDGTLLDIWDYLEWRRKIDTDNYTADTVIWLRSFLKTFKLA